TAVPVALEGDGFADLRQRSARGEVMRDGARRVALARVGDRDALAVVADEEASVARLAAAQGVEDRAVELDLAIAHRDYASGGCFQVGVVAEQQFGRHGMPVYSMDHGIPH